MFNAKSAPEAEKDSPVRNGFCYLTEMPVVPRDIGHNGECVGGKRLLRWWKRFTVPWDNDLGAVLLPVRGGRTLIPVKMCE